MDFVQVVSSYENAIFILLSVVLCLLFFGIVLSLYLRSFKRRDMLEYLYEPVEPNGYFMDEIDGCCRYFAQSMMLRNHGSDFDVFYDRISDRIKPMVLEQRDDGHSFCSHYFSAGFVDFVVNRDVKCTVGQFPKILRDYVRYMRSIAASVNHVDEEFERKLVSDVVDRVMQTESAQRLQDARIESAVSQAVSTVMPEPALVDSLDSVEHERDMLHKRLVTASYNCVVRDIKLHDNKGLNPVYPDLLKHKLGEHICDSKIHTQPKLLSMIDTDKADEFNHEGCYIVFNTYNGKYFVGQSESVYHSVYELLNGYECGCAALKQDIDDGHLVLVKFVGLEESRYSSLARLHRDLILAYDCRQGNGYNR